jgi:glutamate-1-semialdehyde 2,1-aminomutase
VTVDGVGATVRDPHRPGAAGGATEGTILLPFNDATRLARTLESEDVAAVITEPALTNGGGIARPTPQFLNALRSSTAETGTKLIVDETQSVVLGPGGATAAWQVPSDIVVLGKSFALGLPFGAIGLGEGMAEVLHHTADAHRLAGIGSTLAAGPLSFRAASYALTHLDTPEVTDAVNAVAAQLHHEMAEVITQLEMPWRVDRLGAMVTLSFVPGGLSDGAGLRAQEHTAGLRDLILVGMANRGVLVGSLGGAMVVSPSVTRDDVGRVSHAFSSLSRKVSHVCP